MLLIAAFGLTLVFIIILLARYADRGARLENADQIMAELKERLDQATERQEQLTQRVENLETIVTAEAWDALQEGDTERLRLEAPEEPEAASDEERAADLARRLRFRS